MDVYFELLDERFVWDDEKAAGNFRKHGISFETAAEVFIDPFVEFVAADGTDESREAALGTSQTLATLFVVHLERYDGTIRIISARPATARERRFYENRA